MADATLGTATLRTRLDRSGLKTGLNQAKGETQKFAADSGAAIRGIGAAFGAVVASQGVRAYISFMRSSANLAQQADSANRLYEKSLQRTNQSLSEGAGLVDRLSTRFGVANSVIESSATLLLRQGASLDDIERALTAAGASAAAAGFDISTAFDNVATAVATGRSELLETSGIVTNLGPVTQQYAKALGKTVDELTDQEIIQARVNAIYRETASEIEDVDEILQGLPLAQAEVTKQWRTFREDVGGIAAEVITPLTEGLGAVLGYVNDLPEPVKRAGVAMTGAALGATALATGVVAIRAALTGFQALGLLSFGPAGWIVLGITAVAGLVAVLTGKQDSLDTAVKAASDAFNSGNSDSLVGALDDVIDKFDGDLKTSLIAAQDELKETGRVGVEAANNIVRAFESLSSQRALLELGAGINFRPAMSALNQAGASMFGDRAIPDADKAVLDALKSGNIEEALRLVNAVVTLLTTPRSGNLADPAPVSSGAVDALVEFREELRASTNRVAAAEFVPTVDAPPPGRVPPPSDAPAGTPTDPLFVSLDPIRAVNQGRRDEDEFPRTISAGNFRVRMAPPDLSPASLEQRVRARQIAAFQAIDRGLLDAVEEPVPPTLNELVVANATRRFAEIDRALLAAGEEPVPPSLSEQARASARARFAEIDRALLSELGSFGGGALFSANESFLTAEVGREAARFGGLDLTTTNTDRAVTAERELAMAREEAAAANRATILAFTNAEQERASVLRMSGGNADAYTTQIARQAEMFRLAAREGISLTEALNRLTALDALGGERTDRIVFDDFALASDAERGEMFDGWLKAEQDVADATLQAGLDFANTVINAGVATADAISAFREGDTGGGIAALGGLAGGIATLIPGGAAFAPLIQAGFGLLGGLFSGGRNAELESRRAAGAATRGAPAVELNLVVNQSLSVQSLTDTASRSAINGLLDQTVKRLEDAITRNIIPRITALEGAA